MQKFIIAIAAALLAVGCDQQKQASNDRSTSTSSDKREIQKSVKDAKSEVEKQAKAQKDMLDAEAKSAQARLDAEKARAKAAATDAQSKVDAASQNIREAAGSASTKAQQEVGAASSLPSTTSSSSSTSSSSDQQLTEQVRATVTGGSGAEANAEIARNIQVSASGGTVTLKGTVKTAAEKTRLETAAKGVSGVTKVDNQLQVKAE